jgi:hypothetical protein
MKIFSNLVRAAVFAAFATGASALVPTSGGEAQAQGYSHGGHRVQHHRAAHRPVVRHRHVAPRRVHYYRPGVRHHYRPVVRHHYRPVVRYHAPRVRPVYVSPRRCVWRNRWVQTYYGPQLVKQRVCYRRW